MLGSDAYSLDEVDDVDSDTGSALREEAFGVQLEDFPHAPSQLPARVTPVPVRTVRGPPTQRSRITTANSSNPSLGFIPWNKAAASSSRRPTRLGGGSLAAGAAADGGGGGGGGEGEEGEDPERALWSTGPTEPFLRAIAVAVMLAVVPSWVLMSFESDLAWSHETRAAVRTLVAGTGPAVFSVWAAVSAFQASPGGLKYHLASSSSASCGTVVPEMVRVALVEKRMGGHKGAHIEDHIGIAYDFFCLTALAFARPVPWGSDGGGLQPNWSDALQVGLLDFTSYFGPSITGQVVFILLFWLVTLLTTVTMLMSGSGDGGRTDEDRQDSGSAAAATLPALEVDKALTGLPAKLFFRILFFPIFRLALSMTRCQNGPSVAPWAGLATDVFPAAGAAVDNVSVALDPADGTTLRAVCFGPLHLAYATPALLLAVLAFAQSLFYALRVDSLVSTPHMRTLERFLVLLAITKASVAASVVYFSVTTVPVVGFALAFVAVAAILVAQYRWQPNLAKSSVVNNVRAATLSSCALAYLWAIYALATAGPGARPPQDGAQADLLLPLWLATSLLLVVPLAVVVNRRRWWQRRSHNGGGEFTVPDDYPTTGDRAVNAAAEAFRLYDGDDAKSVQRAKDHLRDLDAVFDALQVGGAPPSGGRAEKHMQLCCQIGDALLLHSPDVNQAEGHLKRLKQVCRVIVDGDETHWLFIRTSALMGRLYTTLGGYAAQVTGQREQRRVSALHLPFTQAQFDTVKFDPLLQLHCDWYNIKWDDPLGHGTFGTVYRAIETHHPDSHGRTVALKLMNKNSPAVHSSLQDLAYEVNIMRDLKHPNIIELHRTHETHDMVVLALELCKGGELFEVLCEQHKQHIHMSIQHVGKIMFEMCDALNYMHRRHVVHRDIKPQNILIVETADGPLVKLADFGLARQSDNNKFDEFCGSPGYMAPEVIRLSIDDCGDSDESEEEDKEEEELTYGVECDMFSLGAVFHILILGIPAFRGSVSAQSSEDYQDQVASKVLNDDWDHCKGPFWKETGDDAKALCRSLLHTSATERITAAEALQHKFIVNINENKTPFSSDYYKRLNDSRELIKKRNRGLAAIRAAVRMQHAFGGTKKDHARDDLITAKRMAKKYIAEGNYGEAAGYFHQIATVEKRTHGERSTEYATALYKLAHLYKEQGLWEEAAPLYAEAYDIRQEALGPDHHDTIVSGKISKMASQILLSFRPEDTHTALDRTISSVPQTT